MKDAPDTVRWEDHWDAFGRLVEDRIGPGSDEPLRDLMYDYWSGLYPEAESVDHLVDGMLDEVGGIRERIVRIEWTPGWVLGDATETLEVLRVGDLAVVASLDPHGGVGWRVASVGDARDAAIDFLYEVLHDASPIPDRIESILDGESMRAVLLSILRSHGEHTQFSWSRVAEKVGVDTADHEGALDRYLASHVD